LHPLASDKPFPKTISSSNNLLFKISQKPSEISKKYKESKLQVLKFDIVNVFCLDNANSFRDIRVQRIAKITLLPKLWGKILVRLYGTD